jgi:predicted CopG family antitoxin
MYDSCMATKTISIELDVYDRLRALRESPSESFSQVLRRELPAVRGESTAEVLRRSQMPGGLLQLSEEQLQDIEVVRETLNRWEDPWTR